MSSEELVGAYVDGGLSRRTFIRRLVAAGVSLGAAVSYAHLLAPDRAAADHTELGADFYNPDPGVRIKSKSVEGVVERGKIAVIVHVEEPATIFLAAGARIRGQLVDVARQKRVRFDQAGKRLVRMRLNRRGRNIFERRNRSKVTVFATAVDGEGGVGLDQATKQLK